MELHRRPPSNPWPSPTSAQWTKSWSWVGATHEASSERDGEGLEPAGAMDPEGRARLVSTRTGWAPVALRWLVSMPASHLGICRGRRKHMHPSPRGAVFALLGLPPDWPALGQGMCAAGLEIPRLGNKYTNASSCGRKCSHGPW